MVCTCFQWLIAGLVCFFAVNNRDHYIVQPDHEHQQLRSMFLSFMSLDAVVDGSSSTGYVWGVT